MSVTESEVESLLHAIHSDVSVLKERQQNAESASARWRIETSDKIDGVIRRQDKTNGTVAGIDHKQTLQDGAMSVLKWQAGVTIAIVSAGAAVAGVVLSIVAQG